MRYLRISLWSLFLIGCFATTPEQEKINGLSFVASPDAIEETHTKPVVAVGARSAIQYLKSSEKERMGQQQNVQILKSKMKTVGLPMLSTTSHIIPVMVRNSGTCKAICDYLLETEKIYIQPINYPTVPAGTERLRITPSPLHTEEQMDKLVDALLRAWDKFHLELEVGVAPDVKGEDNFAHIPLNEAAA